MAEAMYTDPSQRKDGYMEADGHTMALQVMEHFLQVVKDTPTVGYAQVVLVEHSNERPPFGGMGGDINLEPKVERALHSAGEGCRERIINRILPARDPNSPASYAVYNVPSGSISYDFIAWLIDAEMTRQIENEPGPLRVHFWFGRDGKAGLYDDSQRRMFHNVIRPALALVGAVEDEDAKYGRDYRNRHLRMVVTHSAVADVPKLKATQRGRTLIKDWLGEGPAPVTITLREAKHWPHRNSLIDEWIRFANYLEAKGERVIFVRDADKAEVPLHGFDVCGLAASDLHCRMALVEASRMNLYVANGPCELAKFSDAPWLIFTPIEPDDSVYRANTGWFWRAHVGIDVGQQYPWSRPKDQRIVWEQATYDTLVKAWEEFDQ